MTVSLFDDQAHDVDVLRQLLREHKRVLYQLPTGGGKSVVAGYIASRVRQRGKRILILVHRRELVQQFYSTLEKSGLADDIGVVCRGIAPDPFAPIQIAMVFTVARRGATAFSPQFAPDIIFVDEAHHIRAKSWETVLSIFPAARVIGMTATPARLDGKGLDTHFDAIHCGLSVPQLIAKGRLSRVRTLQMPPTLSYEGVKMAAGEYNKKQLAGRVTERFLINGVNAYLRHANGKPAIFFGIDKKHAKETAEKFRAAGVRAEYVGDDTELQSRVSRFRDFAEGLIDVICNVNIVSEGFDVPRCEVVLDAAPTLSLTMYLQRAGRMMRFVPGKVGTLIDLTVGKSADTPGNSIMHGLPDEEGRLWSLEGGAVRSPRGRMRPGGDLAHRRLVEGVRLQPDPTDAARNRPAAGL